MGSLVMGVWQPPRACPFLRVPGEIALGRIFLFVTWVMDVFAKCLERIIEFEQSSVEALSL